jgi:hypothetical protein
MSDNKSENNPEVDPADLPDDVGVSIRKNVDSEDGGEN